MPWPDLVSAAKSLFLALVFYVATVTFLKISLGVFLLRIINTKGQRMLIYAVMTVSTVWGLVAIFVAIFQCGYPYSAGYFLLRRECSFLFRAANVLHLHVITTFRHTKSLTAATCIHVAICRTGLTRCRIRRHVYQRAHGHRHRLHPRSRQRRHRRRPCNPAIVHSQGRPHQQARQVGARLHPRHRRYWQCSLARPLRVRA